LAAIALLTLLAAPVVHNLAKPTAIADNLIVRNIFGDPWAMTRIFAGSFCTGAICWRRVQNDDFNMDTARLIVVMIGLSFWMIAAITTAASILNGDDRFASSSVLFFLLVFSLGTGWTISLFGAIAFPIGTVVIALLRLRDRRSATFASNPVEISAMRRCLQGGAILLAIASALISVVMFAWVVVGMVLNTAAYLRSFA